MIFSEAAIKEENKRILIQQVLQPQNESFNWDSDEEEEKEEEKVEIKEEQKEDKQEDKQEKTEQQEDKQEKVNQQEDKQDDQADDQNSQEIITLETQSSNERIEKIASEPIETIQEAISSNELPSENLPIKHDVDPVIIPNVQETEPKSEKSPNSDWDDWE